MKRVNLSYRYDNGHINSCSFVLFTLQYWYAEIIITIFVASDICKNINFEVLCHCLGVVHDYYSGRWNDCCIGVIK